MPPHPITDDPGSANRTADIGIPPSADASIGQKGPQQAFEPPSAGDQYIEPLPTPLAIPPPFQMPKALGTRAAGPKGDETAPGSKENPIDLTLSGGGTWKLPANSKDIAEPMVDEIVRAIVAQDRELYPGGDASRMSTAPIPFSSRWYRIGGGKAFTRRTGHRCHGVNRIRHRFHRRRLAGGARHADHRHCPGRRHLRAVTAPGSTPSAASLPLRHPTAV